MNPSSSHPNASQLILPAPSPFDFQLTATSNGWFELAPNSWDAERSVFQRVHLLGSGKVMHLGLAATEENGQPAIAVQASSRAPLSQSEQEQLARDLRYMFRLDEDLSEFYALCTQRGGRWLKLTRGLGRLLRSPSLFEDVVKTICTTNVQWGGTKGMIRRLTGAFGEPFPGDPALRAFPTPQALAAVPAEEFASVVRMGYRSAYVHSLASQVASGELELEAWRSDELPTAELHKKLLSIKGVGSYAAANLLTCLGRYDELAVDSAFRQVVSQKYFDGQTIPDRQAQAVYAEWGRWKYLAYWFDIWEVYHRD